MVRHNPVIASVVFGLLLLLGVNWAFVKPDDFSASPPLVAYYTDGANSVQVAIACLAVVLAAGLLLVVQGWLAARIEGASTRTLPTELAKRSATIAATMMGAGAAAWSVAVWNNLFYDELSAETTKLLLMLGWLLLSFVGMFAAALMVGSMSVAMRSVDGVPGWLWGSGFVASALLLLGSMVVPMIVLPVWLALASWKSGQLRGADTNES
jgi:hypothetical protein